MNAPRMAVRAINKKNLVLAGGISTKIHRSDQYNHSCACRRHVLFISLAQWPPELTIESPCPAFTSQTDSEISTKLHSSD